MSNPTAKNPKRLRQLLMTGGAGLAAVTVAVYGIWGGNGNSGTAETCQIAQSMAESVQPHVGGEVAAFIPATSPLDLSTLAFKQADGSDATMADFSGKTVLLNLWATWCAPCRKEMPALDTLQSEMGGEDFEVVAVNVDRGGTEKPEAFLSEINVENLSLRHDGSNKIITDLRKLAKAPGLPTTILIGPDGCEAGTMFGPAEWASKEAKALITSALQAVKPQG
ncbi:thiol:disulfide interchange protein TlpA [Roseibium limicola]|uniref:Redoxin family protein n=1 Tax=Roseibium limicola TaxID=2816037 RepID=A0A939ET21_9HYPH|nr:TlpA disulfide reductase family protein [Roseibium limicola]MBO0347103.1 redoxin family protein [Roseibium limicola]